MRKRGKGDIKANGPNLLDNTENRFKVTLAAFSTVTPGGYRPRKGNGSDFPLGLPFHPVSGDHHLLALTYFSR